MPSKTNIHHIALVVENIQDALTFWRDGLGLELKEVKDLPEEGARVTFLPVGNCAIELVEPTSEDSGIARFLKKRGAGMHHVCFEVEDIEEIQEKLKVQGFRLINETVQIGENGRKYLFIHPESTNGVLVELYEQ